MDFVGLFIYTNLWLWHVSKLSLISVLEVFTGSFAFSFAEMLSVVILVFAWRELLALWIESISSLM